ncbi:sensor domain-containing diguanylate cyclase [uncultured Pseudacidovorax sp.]|uniref:GGDEF domain-containing protein n=1 Tax=uncultured Pseudacidovorax sp. TaxID=679313 RepID=UPI0025CBA49E|nr:sensor domain-containing diguanylate cyclase [uncultured Pseudacidovorax sp.]
MATRFLTLPRAPSLPLQCAGVGLLVFVACLLGILARPTGYLSAFWPANAVMAGLLVRYPALGRHPAAWAAGAVGFVAADLATGASWAMALWLNAANLVDIVVVWQLLHRLDEPNRRLQRATSALYLLLASIAGSAVGALAGSGAGPVFFDAPWTQVLAMWFSTQLMNYLLLLPLVLAAPHADDPPPAPRKVPLALRLAPWGALAAGEGLRLLVSGPGSLVLPLPGLLWCAMSYRMFTSALVSAIVCSWLLVAVALGLLDLNFTPAHAGEVLSLRVGISLLALGPLAVACANAAGAETLRRLDHAVRHDGLTGALARQALLEQGHLGLRQSVADGGGMAVLMIDADHFKQINDRHGHHVGDQVLRALARVTAATLRPQDRLGRMGGEEFAVVLPGVSPAEAQAIAERLRAQVAMQVLATDAQGGDLYATLSIGVAHTDWMGQPVDMHALLLAADEALYRAKAQGRNRIALA